MSRENVEVVKAGFEAWNAGDMDGLREMYDPGIIWRPPEGWPEPGPYAGREAVMRQLEQLRETWDADAFELTSDFIDAADRVAVRLIWRGAGYGPDLNLELTGVYMGARAGSSALSSSGTTRRPSRPWGCLSR